VTAALTVVTMFAFAGNAILCRMALGRGLIDAASFMSIRAASGAIVLTLILLRQHHRLAPSRADWIAASTLFAYMICFTFAYLSLGAGTGALILFGAVQVTMIVVAMRSGERLTSLSWIGFVVAIGGLAWLVSPGLTAPDPTGAVLMALAGVAWGLYSLLGRRQTDPVASTARNFVLATPMTLVVSVLAFGNNHWTTGGIALAMTSGAVTSGLGYVVWYTTVPRLSGVQAASVQLTVPVIAAVCGVLLLGESLTARLVLASVAVLGGVWLVVTRREARGARSDSPRKPA